jgi:hypothetical protein
MSIYIAVIYDSINNSVFQSQVITPLLLRKKADPSLEIHLISFETEVQMSVPKVAGITFHIFKRYPFISRFTLLPAILQLHFYLRKFTSYEILARGPFAGYIAHHAANSRCSFITIQARGLVAEEYRYTRGTKKLNFFEKYRYRQFLTLEKIIYAMQKPHIHFEAVSPALKEYMINMFAPDPKNISIAHKDLPVALTLKQKETFRTAIRMQLNIDTHRVVYCYSGSYKPWQCPEEMITYFKQMYALNKNCFLLILTQDLELFKSTLLKHTLPADAYHISTVHPEKLFRYLAAADVGLLFRENHIINTVSRPTKALEYQAACLTILHNDTVPYIINMEKTLSNCLLSRR